MSNTVTVTRDDLPVHCPTEGSELWNSHPRVFIPVADTGEASCPYCGTEFKLVEDQTESSGGGSENAA